MVAVPPFAVYRFLVGDWLMAAVEAVILLAMVLVCGYALRSGHTRTPSRIMAFVYSGGALAAVALLGPLATYWLYPVVVANFFLLGTRASLAMNAIIVVGLLFLARGAMPPLVLATAFATLGLVAGFAFIFAYQTDDQRRRLQRQATRDALTGAENRRALSRAMALTAERAKRHGGCNVLLVLDLDHFKTVNDRYGHEAGDRLLVQLARLIGQRTRKLDRLFRYGGEEFVLLLPDTSLQQAELVANALRELVQDQLIGPGGAVTASFGCAELIPGEGSEAWFRRADAALYEAKRRGRNRVCLAPGGESAVRRATPPKRHTGH
jgi:diguanylate cyclase (GGDEF)-like protein